MPLLVGHALLGASAVAALSERREGRTEMRGAVMTGAVLGVIPDLDLFFTWILGLGIRWHGGFTHSIVAAIAGGCLAARWSGKRTLRSFLIFFAAMCSHGLLDAATKKTYGGTQLFWPFWSARIKLGLFDYFAFYPDSKLDPLWKLVLRALQISIYELLIFGFIFLMIVIVRSKVDRGAGTIREQQGD